jgi:hypothetical protein
MSVRLRKRTTRTPAAAPRHDEPARGPRIAPAAVLAALMLVAPLAFSQLQRDDPKRAPTPAKSPGKAPPPADDATQPTKKTASPADRRGKEVEGQRLGRDAAALFNKQQYAASEALLLKQIDLTPDNFVPYYNVAACRSMLDDPVNAMSWLASAIARGFIDLRQLETDPSLAAARKTKQYRTLVANWPEVIKRHRDWNVENARVFVGEKIEPIYDDRFRLAYLSEFDEISTTRARDELTKVAEWSIANVFPDLLDDVAKERDPWVVVLLPNRNNFKRWMLEHFGPQPRGSFYTVGGVYSHDDKRLVAQDLGSTLRHEFFHVLHWRDNVRTGNVHPIWVQEGLCSLMEDYDTKPDGTLSPTASWRTNQVRRMADAGRLASIREIATMAPARFSGSRPLANYAMARTIFMFLYDSNKLAQWYKIYNETFNTDPTGIKAFEAVFDKPISQIDADYRTYVRTLPLVPEEVPEGGASLGLDVDNGSGEGPVISSVVTGPANRAGLRRGDIITAINERPTRDLPELVRVLSDFKPGDQVEIAYRRGTKHDSATITLTPKRGGP